MSLLIEKGADPNTRNNLGWSPLHLCVVVCNLDGIALMLAAGASPSLERNGGLTPLEYYHENKRVLPMLLRGGAPLPRSSRARWLDPSCPVNGSYRYNPTMQRYVAKVAATGSWAAYEKAHTVRLVPVFEKIFPRPHLPHEIASHVVRFCFHTGYY